MSMSALVPAQVEKASRCTLANPMRVRSASERRFETARSERRRSIECLPQRRLRKTPVLERGVPLNDPPGP